MDLRRTFARIAIDLDPGGNPVGMHLELHDESGRFSTTVLGRPGPFDTPADCLFRLITEVDRRYGRTLELPL